MPVTAPAIKVVKAGNLVDGQGGPSQQGMAVVVEDGRIARVVRESELAFPEGTSPEVFDFPGATLLPGLVDCHTHTNMPGDGTSVDDVGLEDDGIHLLTGVKQARLALESGVTTMRDNGGWNGVVFSLKEGIHRGLVPGPRIVASGRPITVTGGHCWMMGSEADGVDGVRQMVRQLIKEGADFIKVMTSGGSSKGTMPERPSYSLEELKAIVDEAHKFNRLVGAHSNAIASIVNCLDAGVDMIIHGTFLKPDGSIFFDPAVGERLARSGTWVNPTLHVRRCRIETIEEKRQEVGLTPDEEAMLGQEVKAYEDRLELTRNMYEAGVKVIGGSDCGWYSYPFGQFHRELESLVLSGASPVQAVVAGTRDAASALNVLDKVGTLEAGKEADLLVVDGDPTRDIMDLTRVTAVFKAGDRVS